MRHRRSGRKLGVTTKHRKAMFRNMATDILRNGRINTTDTRAKEIRRVVEKLITLGKNGSLHARRKALGYVRDREVVEKLFSELAERYMERPGGYTRIVKLGYRRGDNAPISLIELVTEEFRPKKKKKKKKSAPGPKTGAKTEASESSKKKSAEELGLVEGDGETKPPEASSPEGEKEAEPAEKSREPKDGGEAGEPEAASAAEAKEEAEPREAPEAAQEPEGAEEPKAASPEETREAEPAEESEEPQAASPEADPSENPDAGEDVEPKKTDSSEETKG